MVKPLAIHLERDIFPTLRESGIRWLTISNFVHAQTDDLVGSTGIQVIRFKGTGPTGRALSRLGTKELRLDTRLEWGQIVDSLVLLAFTGPVLNSVEPGSAGYGGMNRRKVAAAMTGVDGYHKFCADMRYNSAEQVYEVEYSYCELMFSRVVRGYVGRNSRFRDHRVLFWAAPRVALLVAFLCIFPVILLGGHETVAGILWLATTVGITLAAGLGMYTVGSFFYDNEYRDSLIKGYLEQVDELSQIPLVNPNPVIKLDLNGTALYLNPAARTLLDVVSPGGSSPTAVMPSDLAGIISECLASDTAHVDKEFSVENRTLRYRFSVFPNHRSVIASGNDVTELKDVENALRDLNSHLEARVAERTQQLQLTQEAIVLVLAGLAETRDPETGKHLERTRSYVRALAKHLQDHPGYRDVLSEKAIERLYKSAPLHDIGKVGVRDAVLLKPGKLTADEFEEMKKHTELGGRVLQIAEEKVGFDSFLTMAKEIAFAHHEKWNGTGYPHGLKEREIPHSARLMALADVYDALTSRRPYKEPWSHEQARAEILAQEGKHFDPAVVTAFVCLEDEFLAIAKKFAE